MSGKRIVYTKALIDLIAGCIFDGLTDEETAILAKVSAKTIQRLRLGDDCPQIKEATIHKMRKYIAIIRDGNDRTNYWQRVAWFLERRYPDRWAKPEVLLNVNASTNTTNQTIVITAEQAADLKSRNASIDQELAKLSPPARRQDVLAEAISKESLNSSAKKTGEDFVVNKEVESGAAPVPRTPDPAAIPIEPTPTPKSKSVATSRNSKSKTDSPAVENSRNSRDIPPGGIKRKRGMGEKMRKSL